jgi:pimeloyl-ACP methyl ester carboxylesterase
MRDKNQIVSILTVPCFSGAPWDSNELTALSHRPLYTMRLPEGLDSIEAYADFVEAQSADKGDYVLLGDSFGAVVSLAVATRQPSMLKGLVISGGFAENPVTDPLMKLKIKMARFLPGPLYRVITLRFHAASLASPYDGEGDRPWSFDVAVPGRTRPLTLSRSFLQPGPEASGSDRPGLLCSESTGCPSSLPG